MIAQVHSHYTTDVRELACTRLAYRQSVTAPYESITLTVKGSPTQRPVTFGDWVVLRHTATTPAVAFGIVVGVNNTQSVSQAGVPDLKTWSVSCVGWLDLLGRTDFQVAYGLRTKQDASTNGSGAGTLFDPSEVTKIAEIVADARASSANALDLVKRAFGEQSSTYRNLFQVFGTYDVPGTALAWFVLLSARLTLPQSLGGQTIGQSVGVAHNDDTMQALAGAGQYDRSGAPAYVMDPVPSRSMPNLASLFASTKMLALMRSTWGGDENLIEMFPVLLDPPSSLAGVPAPEAAPDPTGSSGLLYRGKTQDAAPSSFQGLVEPDLERVSPPTAGSALLAGLAGVLGRNPVLMYRLKPWRTQPLADWARGVAAHPGLTYLPASSVNIGKMATAVSDYVGATGIFSRITWSASQAQTFSAARETVRLQQSSSDDDAPNVFTTEWPGLGSPAGYLAAVGLPIVMTFSSLIGSKLYQATWPFMRDQAKRAAAEQSVPAGQLPPDSMANEAVTVAAQAAQWLGFRALSMMRGGFEAAYRPDVLPGKVTAVQWPDGTTLTCYADAVEHTLTMTGGRFTARTAVSFSRGLWDEAERYVEVPVPTRKVQTDEARRDARGLATDAATTGYRSRVDDGVTPLRDMMPPTGLE